MSQFERVNVSLALEGETIRLSLTTAKCKPKLGMVPKSKVETEAGEWIIKEVNGKKIYIRV